MKLSWKDRLCGWLIVVFLTLANNIHGAPREETNLSDGLLDGCPDIQGVPNFSLTKFQGSWLVGHHFHLDAAPCQALFFKPISDSEITIGIGLVVSFNLTAQAGARGKVLDKNNPGSMVWSWNFLPTKLERVTVVDTDYDNYAILIFCMEMGSYTQRAAMLLTRDHTKASLYLPKARKILEPMIQLPPFTQVQDACSQLVSPNSKTLNVDRLYTETIDMIINFNTLRLGSYLTKR